MSDDPAIDAPLEPTPTAAESPATTDVDAAEETTLADPLAGRPCPYLLAESGEWRSSSPAREHRCTAFAPPAPLALEKQRRLCLTASHETCATYLAALEARRERGAPADAPVMRWAVARTTPLVDVGVGLGAAATAILAERRGWQAIPAVVLVLAVAAVAFSGFGRNGPVTGAANTATPTVGATPDRTARPTIAPTPGPTTSPGVTPLPSVAATPAATPTVAPTATPAAQATPRASYTVKRNDTLYGIAIAYSTSVAAIKKLNGLTSDVLHIGQVLLIP